MVVDIKALLIGLWKACLAVYLCYLIFDFVSFPSKDSPTI